MQKLRYIVQAGNGVYGDRVWIEQPEDSSENPIPRGSPRYDRLARLSSWGGHDKSGENYIAFEIPTTDARFRMVFLLEVMGFTDAVDDWSWLQQ